MTKTNEQRALEAYCIKFKIPFGKLVEPYLLEDEDGRRRHLAQEIFRNSQSSKVGVGDVFRDRYERIRQRCIRIANFHPNSTENLHQCLESPAARCFDESLAHEMGMLLDDLMINLPKPDVQSGWIKPAQQRVLNALADHVALGIGHSWEQSARLALTDANELFSAEPSWMPLPEPPEHK